MRWLDFALPVLGRFSHGWQLARQQGKMAAELIEHVLENRAVGRGTVGVWVDRQFLQQRHWQGLRSLHLATEDILGSLVHKRSEYGLETFVLDLGCGSARYAWRLLRSTTGLSILCLRRSPHEVAHGRETVADRFGERLSFSIGDRCDPASYLMPREADVVLCLAPSSWFTELREWDIFSSLVFRSLSLGGLFLFGTFTLGPAFGKRPASPLSLPLLTPTLERVGFQQITVRTATSWSFLLEVWKSVRWSAS